jgi:hypothetical protein
MLISLGSIPATCVGGRWIFHNKHDASATTEAQPVSAPSVSTQVDEQDVVKLAVQLINIQSTSGSETPMADALEHWLSKRGWKVTKQRVTESRFNIYAQRHDNGKPSLIFNSHLDTVPPFFPAEVTDEVIKGRGACDTKSLVASILTAAQQLVEEDKKFDKVCYYRVMLITYTGDWIAICCRRGSRSYWNEGGQQTRFRTEVSYRRRAN